MSNTLSPNDVWLVDGRDCGAGIRGGGGGGGRVIVLWDNGGEAIGIISDEVDILCLFLAGFLDCLSPPNLWRPISLDKVARGKHQVNI